MKNEDRDVGSKKKIRQTKEVLWRAKQRLQK